MSFFLHKNDGKPKWRQKLMVFRVNEEEMAAIQSKADQYTCGVVSDWIRYAVKLEPRKEDLKKYVRRMQRNANGELEY